MPSPAFTMSENPSFDRWLRVATLPDVTCSYLWISYKFSSFDEALAFEPVDADAAELLDAIQNRGAARGIPGAHSVSHYFLERNNGVQHIKCNLYHRREPDAAFAFSEDMELWTSTKTHIVIRPYSRKAIVTTPDDGGSGIAFLPELLYLFSTGISCKRPSVHTWYALQFTSSKARVSERELNTYQIEYVPYGGISQEPTRAEMEDVLEKYPEAKRLTAEVTLSDNGLPRTIIDWPMFSRVWEYAALGDTYYPVKGIYGGGNATSGSGSVLLMLPDSLKTTERELPDVNETLIPPGIRVTHKVRPENVQEQ